MWSVQLLLPSIRKYEASYAFTHRRETICLQAMQLLLQTESSFEESHEKAQCKTKCVKEQNGKHHVFTKQLHDCMEASHKKLFKIEYDINKILKCKSLKGIPTLISSPSPLTSASVTAMLCGSIEGGWVGLTCNLLYNSNSEGGRVWFCEWSRFASTHLRSKTFDNYFSL